jgi:type VI secretion system protein ImpC
MPKPLSFGHIGVELATQPAPAGGVPQAEAPLRLILLGDWSGRASRRMASPASRLAGRRPVRVDRDNLDAVIQKFGVELLLPVANQGDARVPIRFAELDDFHPDRLFQRLEVFQAFRELRAKLSDPSTFAKAADEMRSRTAGAEVSPAAEPAQVPPDNLLEHILGGPVNLPPPSPSVPRGGDWQAVIQKIVEPYLAPRIDTARQAELVALVDDATSGYLRAILHHPDFQALEAAWRGVHFLVRRLDTDAGLHLYLFDVTKEELATDLTSADDLRSTGLYKLLVEQTVGTPGALPWGIVIGHYTFNQSHSDVEMLGRVAKIAQQAGAPFLAAAADRVLGCASLAATPDPADWLEPVDPQEAAGWEALRRLPEAAYLGLALPRFLLRLPYGKETSAIEQFDFEEMPEGSRHEDYLWGHPAIACGYLMAVAFNQFGWGFRPGRLQEMDGLPMHVYQEARESQLKPCAEVVLTERALEAILGKGLMPLASVQGRDAVRVARFQALANPATPLAGRWESR